MIEAIDRKKLSRAVSETHREKGQCLHILNEGGRRSGGVIVSVKVPRFWSLEGKILTLKTIRKFLWESRNFRAVKRDGAVLWTVYDPEVDVSYLGLGLLIEPTILVRIRRQEPDREALQVA